MKATVRMSASELHAINARAKSEDTLHQEIATWLSEVLIWPTRMDTNIMNSRSAIQGAKNRRRGAIKGKADISILRTCGRVAWIEVKTLKGRLTPEQREFQVWCHDAGHPHCVARSVEDVRNFLEAENIRTRESETRGDAAARLLAGMDRKRAVA